MFDFLLKGKNFDVEILKILKEKISIKLEVKEVEAGFRNDLIVSILYTDDKNNQHVVTSSTLTLATELKERQVK